MNDKPDEAIKNWKTYIHKSPNGRFSLLAAKEIIKLTNNLTPEEHFDLGQVYFNHEDWGQAEKHLKKAPYQKAWLTLGETLIHKGEKTQGIQQLEKGLESATSRQEAEEAIQTMIYALPKFKRFRTMKALQGKNIPFGRDFALWKLEIWSSGQSKYTYAAQLVNRYPNSNWAPESSWLLVWKAFKSGNKQMFLDKANKHLERYPHSRSAPKIMFWKAKTLEKQGHKSGALTLYKTLYETYPNQFYAFRAQQIVGNVGQPWKTDPHAIYPPNKFNNRDTTHLARYMKDPLLFPLTEELIAVEAWGDVSYLANIVHNGKPPPPLESWMLHQKGELALSIRIIRDYLDDSRGKGKPVKDPTLSKLLYPIVHTSEIKKHSQFNNLDPFLVQALTRQESYFNRLAVSSSRAMGLMQLLPSTAKDVAKWEKMSNFNTTSLFEPNTNVRLGYLFTSCAA